MFEPVIDKARNMPTEMVETAKKFWFAGLGVMVLAQEETTKVWDGLVTKGETYDVGNAQLARLTGTVKNVGERAVDVLQKVNKGVETQVTAVLHRVGVPTTDEIAVLTQKVEVLSVGVEKLKAKSAKPESKAEKAHEPKPEGHKRGAH